MIRKTLPPENKTIFNTSEACGYLDVCWNTMKALIDNGEIRVVRIGRKYLITKEAIDNFVKRDDLISKIISRGIN